MIALRAAIGSCCASTLLAPKAATATTANAYLIFMRVSPDLDDLVFSSLGQTPFPAAYSGVVLEARRRTRSRIRDQQDGQETPVFRAFSMACQMRWGVAGMSIWRMRWLRQSASTMALSTAGQEPMAPASPAPLTPSGLVLQGTLRVSKTKSGACSARGMA